jgi:hypothetical protein
VEIVLSCIRRKPGCRVLPNPGPGISLPFNRLAGQPRAGVIVL